MKNVLLFVIAFLFIWQCSDKNPLEIAGTSLKLSTPKDKPIINRADYVSGSSFLPGYQNGKIRSDRIMLEWPVSTESNFLCYKIYRDNVERKTIADQTVNSYLDSNLVDNWSYDYRIVTMNKSGLYTSDTIKLKTPRFDPPFNFGYQVRSTSSVKIFWENIAESATNFDIYKKLVTDPDSSYQLITTATDTFYIDNNVTNFQQYNYQIIAYNQYESTLPSVSFFVNVNYTLFTPSLNSLIQDNSSRMVTLNWSDISTAEDFFLIYRSNTFTNFQLIASVPTNTTEYVDTDTSNSLFLDSTYYYAVRAYNVLNDDTTGYSNIRNITIHEPMSERTLSYYVQGGPEQPDGSENLNVYYYNNSGTWQLIRTITPPEVGSFTYFEDTITNADAQHAGFKIKFEQDSHSGNNFDNYYLDNVELSEGTSTIFSDTFNSSTISFSNWPNQIDVQATSSYFISSPYSVMFEGNNIRTLESRVIPW